MSDVDIFNTVPLTDEQVEDLDNPDDFGSDMPVAYEPYYLIERNDRGQPKWLLWPKGKPVEWTTDSMEAWRFSAWFDAGKIMRLAEKELLVGVVMQVTEHLDCDGPPRPGDLP